MRAARMQKIIIYFKENNQEITCFLKDAGEEKWLIQS